MYIATQHTSETPARAYRIQSDNSIWAELAPRVKIALELNAAKAEARGAAA